MSNIQRLLRCKLPLALVIIIWTSTACDRSNPVDGSGSSDALASLAYGTKVDFGQDGTSEKFRYSGWSKTEEKFTWSEGTPVTLKMRIFATQDSVTLRMKLSGLIKEPELPFQPVEVLVNDQKIADWQVGDVTDFVAAIPHDITKKGGELTITLKVPKATSPKALGLNADPRILGICCHELELNKG
jgi:hypothetical protein